MASSDGKCSSAKMKPIPQSPAELKKEVQEMSLFHLRPNAEPSPRAKLCHFMTASGQIKRSPCYTSILMVGVTGVGKSSTVNHLLNTSGAIKFAKTHDTRSATRDTSEFIHENRISSTGADMLEKKFGIKEKAVVLDSGIL